MVRVVSPARRGFLLNILNATPAYELLNYRDYENLLAELPINYPANRRGTAFETLQSKPHLVYQISIQLRLQFSFDVARPVHARVVSQRIFGNISGRLRLRLRTTFSFTCQTERHWTMRRGSSAGVYVHFANHSRVAGHSTHKQLMFILLAKSTTFVLQPFYCPGQLLHLVMPNRPFSPSRMKQSPEFYKATTIYCGIINVVVIIIIISILILLHSYNDCCYDLY